MSLNYSGLRGRRDAAHISSRLLAMRHGSLADLRAQRDERSLLLATWNIRDFDSNKFGQGPRLAESLYYLAEIIDCFDLVAVQEVTEDLRPFERLVRILGREWDYLLTDVTEGASGNHERMAYLYRTDSVFFRRISGEVVLPQGQLIVAPEAVKAPTDAEPEAEPRTTEGAGHQFARSPYLVAFQAGWFRFVLCTVHIYFGADSGARLRRRIAEIERLVRFFADRQDDEAKRAAVDGDTGSVENYILLGDFNVVSPEHETMAALVSHGFEVPDAIDGDAIGTRDHFYDQIAVRVKDPRFRVTGGGIVPMYAEVFTDADEPAYRDRIPVPDADDDESVDESDEARLDRFRTWRTWQMSDHSPLWVRIDVDFADSYLGELSAGE